MTSKRPASLYDNIEQYDHEDHTRSGAVPLVGMSAETAASIRFSDRTTVPQNLIFEPAKSPGERHTPTKNSLRHSRMIVMNRTRDNGENGTVLRSDLRRMFVVFDILKICAGILIVSISAWIILWIPNLNLLQKPFWAGLPIILSGVYGFIVICCFKGRSRISKKCFSTKHVEVCGIIVTIFCGILCCMGFVFVSLHLWTVPDVSCISSDGSCFCHDASYSPPHPHAVSRYIFDPIFSFTCDEAKDILVVLLIVLAVACAFGCLLSFIYTYFYVAHFKYHIYSKVHIAGHLDYN